MRQWPHDYWKTISWQLFQGHLAFERERAQREAREEERARQTDPIERGRTSGTYGRPPPIEVLKQLPGWGGGDG